jgi:hypothetical protein
MEPDHPYFQSSPSVEEVKVGERVSFECRVANLGQYSSDCS